jgi:RHS repeat-associated protein
VGKLLEKVANGGNLDYRHYIYAGSELVAIYSRQSSGTNTVRYVLGDHQSSFSGILSSTGTLDVSESFAPYGNRRSGETWSGAPSTTDETAINGISRQGYTGQTMLGVSMGLIHMNGRVADAITGRFLSPDPTIPSPGNTQSFNRYSYVFNNPLTMTDASGFSPCELQSCRKSSCNAQCVGDYYYAGFASGTDSLSDGALGVDDSMGSIYSPDVFDSDAGLSYSQEVTGSATVGQPYSSNNANSGSATGGSVATDIAGSGTTTPSSGAAQSQNPAQSAAIGMAPSTDDGIDPVVVTAQRQQQGFGSNADFAGSSIDQISEVIVQGVRSGSLQNVQSISLNPTRRSSFGLCILVIKFTM